MGAAKVSMEGRAWKVIELLWGVFGRDLQAGVEREGWARWAGAGKFMGICGSRWE